MRIKRKTGIGPRDLLDFSDEVDQYGWLRASVWFDSSDQRSFEVNADEAQQIVDHLTRVFSLEKKAC